MKTKPKNAKLSLEANRRKEKSLYRNWKAATKFDSSSLVVVKCEWIGRGVTQYTAFSTYGDCPLGFVWVRSANSLLKTALIIRIFTNPIARRKNIATLMQDEIFKDFDLCVSPFGTKEGEAWMRHYGYRYSPERGMWECHNKANP